VMTISIARTVVRVAALLGFSAVCAVAAGTGNPEVRVRVQDPKGGMISKAFVVIHHEWDPRANEGVDEHQRDELMRVTFDGTSDFVITVKPGFYDVYVSSFGYDPKCMKVHLQYGADRALVFQLAENKWIYTPMVE
jgi:hypothetical protein